jgi:hypothetical protein
MRKYALPTSLAEVVEQPVYEKWLHRRAVAHVRRDKKKRKNQTATTELYKQAIHKAVSESNGLDAYTKERLDWTLLSEWNNEDSMKGGRVYKRKFSLLPSVDHVGDGTGSADFRICAWRTNDSKHDMSYEEFLDFCWKVLRAAGKWPGDSSVLK